MARHLLSQQFSSSTLMDGVALVKSEAGLSLPSDDEALDEELQHLEVLDFDDKNGFQPQWVLKVSSFLLC